MKLGIVGGKCEDPYPYKHTSKHAPAWLRAIKAHKDLREWCDQTSVPSDVAMALYLRETKKADVDMLGAEDVMDRPFAALREYDLIVVVWDAVEVFYRTCDKGTTCPDDRDRFLRRLQRRTRPRRLPYPEFHARHAEDGFALRQRALVAPFKSLARRPSVEADDAVHARVAGRRPPLRVRERPSTTR